jgi:TatA/E family protein of Tat protein translocase
MTLLFLESLGTTELLLILVAALVLFGPRRLPELSRSLGKGLNEFKRASDEFKRTWEREANLDSYERERRIGEAMLPPDEARAAADPSEGGVITSDGDLIAAPPDIASDATEGSHAPEGSQPIATGDSLAIARGDAQYAASAGVTADADGAAEESDAAAATAPQSPHKTDWL